MLLLVHRYTKSAILSGVHHMFVLICDFALADRDGDAVHELLIDQVHINEAIESCKVSHFTNDKLSYHPIHIVQIDLELIIGSSSASTIF